MAGPGIALVPVHEIELGRFYQSVARRLAGQVQPIQIREVLLGIANLYADRAVASGTRQLELDTEHCFISADTSKAVVLKEIGNCAGTGKKDSSKILHALEQELVDQFAQYGPKITTLLLKPIGNISRPDNLRYHISFHRG